MYPGHLKPSCHVWIRIVIALEIQAHKHDTLVSIALQLKLMLAGTEANYTKISCTMYTNHFDGSIRAVCQICFAHVCISGV